MMGPHGAQVSLHRGCGGRLLLLGPPTSRSRNIYGTFLVQKIDFLIYWKEETPHSPSEREELRSPFVQNILEHSLQGGGSWKSPATEITACNFPLSLTPPVQVTHTAPTAADLLYE